MEAAAGMLKYSGSIPNGDSVTENLFKQAVADNIQVIRAFGHGATPSFKLQTAPGECCSCCPHPVRLVSSRTCFCMVQSGH